MRYLRYNDKMFSTFESHEIIIQRISVVLMYHRLIYESVSFSDYTSPQLKLICSPLCIMYLEVSICEQMTLKSMKYLANNSIQSCVEILTTISTEPRYSEWTVGPLSSATCPPMFMQFTGCH